MVWYAVEPLVTADRSRAMSVAAVCQIPTVRRFMARRTVEADPAAGLAAVLALLKTADNAGCFDLLIGTHDGLRGRKHIARPEGWPEVFANLVARPSLDGRGTNPAPGARPGGTQGSRGLAAGRS